MPVLPSSRLLVKAMIRPSGDQSGSESTVLKGTYFGYPPHATGSRASRSVIQTVRRMLQIVGAFRGDNEASAVPHAQRDRRLVCPGLADCPDLDRHAAELAEEEASRVLRVERRPLSISTQRQADAARHSREAVPPRRGSAQPAAVIDEHVVLPADEGQDHTAVAPREDGERGLDRVE